MFGGVEGCFWLVGILKALPPSPFSQSFSIDLKTDENHNSQVSCVWPCHCRSENVPDLGLIRECSP